MIKVGLRNNLFYPAMLIILNFFRTLDLFLLRKLLKFQESLIITQLMFLSELISGFFIYKYNLNILTKKDKENEAKTNKIILIHGENSFEMARTDGRLKIYLYTFSISLIDFLDFLLSTLYFPQIYNDGFSKSLDIRLKSIIAIHSILLCHFLLEFRIYKHQKCSLIIIFICLIFIVTFEYYFLALNKKIVKSPLDLTIILVLMALEGLFYSFVDIIEKYLLEYDFLNPFLLLMNEGIFGLILAIIFSFIKNPFEEFKTIYKDKFKFILLIFGLIIYLIASGLSNSYRIITNKLYSPTTLLLSYCFLVPIYIAYYYFKEEDFLINNKGNIVYFIINLILSLIIVVCIFIYNEVFVLLCFDLDHNTHLQISSRSRYEEINHDISLESNTDSYIELEKSK